jgi:inorganic pyrophosphatase
VQEIDDVPDPLRAEISHFFDVYKMLEPDKHSNTRGFEGTDAAWTEIAASIARYRPDADH